MPTRLSYPQTRTALLLFFGCLMVCCREDARAQAATETAISPATAKGAVSLVANSYAPSPLAKTGPEGLPMPKNGSWSVRKPTSAESPKSCSESEAGCIAVLYKAGAPQEICEWTVGGKTFQVLDQNEAATRLMVRLFRYNDPLLPNFIGGQPLRYPPELARSRQAANVTFNAFINGGGQVKDAVLVEGNAAFRDDAAASILSWTLQPFLVNGKAVPYMRQIVVHYSIR